MHITPSLNDSTTQKVACHCPEEKGIGVIGRLPLVRPRFCTHGSTLCVLVLGLPSSPGHCPLPTALCASPHKNQRLVIYAQGAVPRPHLAPCALHRSTWLEAKGCSHTQIRSTCRLAWAPHPHCTLCGQRGGTRGKGATTGDEVGQEGQPNARSGGTSTRASGASLDITSASSSLRQDGHRQHTFGCQPLTWVDA